MSIDVELGGGAIKRRNNTDDEELEKWAEDEEGISKDDSIHMTWAAITFCVMGFGLVFPGSIVMVLSDSSENQRCRNPIVGFLQFGACLTIIYVMAVFATVWMTGNSVVTEWKERAAMMRTVAMPLLSVCCVVWLLFGARWVREERGLGEGGCAGTTAHTLATMAAAMPLLTFPCCCTYFWLPKRRYS